MTDDTSSLAGSLLALLVVGVFEGAYVAKDAAIIVLAALAALGWAT